MELHTMIKRMSRKHFEVVAHRLHANVPWETRPDLAHAIEYADMHEAVGALYVDEGDPMTIPNYPEMTAGQLVSQLGAEMHRTFERYGGESKVRNDAVVFVDVGLIKSLVRCTDTKALNVDHPATKVADLMYGKLVACIQDIQDDPNTNGALLDELHQLVSNYEIARWEVPKVLKQSAA